MKIKKRMQNGRKRTIEALDKPIWRHVDKRGPLKERALRHPQSATGEMCMDCATSERRRRVANLLSSVSSLSSSRFRKSAICSASPGKKTSLKK